MKPLTLITVLALYCSTQAPPAIAAQPAVVTNTTAYGFPNFLETMGSKTKGWIFARPDIGLRCVELNGVLLLGNGGTNDPGSGLAMVGSPAPYLVDGFDWEQAKQRPARNGLCRGGIRGSPGEFSLLLEATPGRSYLLDVLALATVPKRSMSVAVNGQTVAPNWTVVADKARNCVLRVRVVPDTDKIEVRFASGPASDGDPNPAITAVALTDITDGIWQYDPLFRRVPVGLENIAGQGVASSPDNLEQDGDGRGDRAAIDGDPATYWDEQDRAGLYRLIVTFKQPEPVAALALMGWAHHDYAPKDFEVFCDDRPVKQVSNAQYAANVLLVPFEETTCRAVEVKMTGHYGGSPAIRELGVFRRLGQGRVPGDPASAPAVMTADVSNGTECILKFKERPVMVYAYAPDQWKPYVRELYTLRGDNILRDSPWDHKHHHALMYGIKVNGVNFWEETPGCGYQKPVKTQTPVCGRDAAGHPQASLRQTIHWLAAEDVKLPDTASAALLIEERTLTVTVNEASREVAFHWQSEFVAGSKSNQVILTGANYHGLGMRFLQELDPLAVHVNAGGKPDLSGNKQDVSQHPWGSVSFDRPNQPATMVLFGHPSNARGYAWYFSMRTPFAYVSATQNLDQEPLVYRRGDKFQLHYLVTLYPELVSSETIQRRAAAWQAVHP